MQSDVIPVTSSVCDMKEARGMYDLRTSHTATTVSSKWEQLKRDINN